VSELAQLIAALRAGGVVACPTETFVGLLADALDPRAVERVSALKRRDAGLPIGVLLPDVSALSLVASSVPERVLMIAARHWPGPLTLLVPVKAGLPQALSKAGKIGVRVPGPSPALDLVRAFGGPLTATSANLSGEPAARDEADVRRAFPQGLAAVVPGLAPGGLASSVIDVCGDVPVVVRAGPIGLADL
jgi:L-threonylcarbamoyladenylate synthase